MKSRDVNCPDCGGELTVLTDDLRQEWERITYLCGGCDVEHERLIIFKTQSRMIESDEWVGREPEVVDEPPNDINDIIICARAYLTLVRCKECKRLYNKGYQCIHCGDAG